MSQRPVCRFSISVGTLPTASTDFVGAILVRARSAPVVFASAHTLRLLSPAIVFGTGVSVWEASRPWSTDMYGVENVTVFFRAGVIEIWPIPTSNGFAPAL